MIQFRELQWASGTGYRLAFGVCDRYKVMKNNDSAGYSLYSMAPEAFVGKCLGENFRSYSAAQKAAEKDNQAILAHWIIQSPQEEASK